MRAHQPSEAASLMEDSSMLSLTRKVGQQIVLEFSGAQLIFEVWKTDAGRSFDKVILKIRGLSSKPLFCQLSYDEDAEFFLGNTVTICLTRARGGSVKFGVEADRAVNITRPDAAKRT